LLAEPETCLPVFTGHLHHHAALVNNLEVNLPTGKPPLPFNYNEKLKTKRLVVNAVERSSLRAGDDAHSNAVRLSRLSKAWCVGLHLSIAST